MQSDRQRVIVIGGGVLGCSTAAQLARAGSVVTLLTDRELASGASGRSLSWLNSAGDRSPEYHRLRTIGIDRYRTRAGRDADAGWANGAAREYTRFDGGLTWARPGASLWQRHEHENAIGYDSLWLDREDVAVWTPGVNLDAIHEEGAIFNPGEGWVDLPALISHLVQEIAAAGGDIREGVGKVSVERADGRARGARTASGELFEADAVVLATGPSVPRDLAALGIDMPESTPISLLVATKPVDVPLRAVLNTPRVAVRPTPFGNLVLDSGWSEREVVVRDDGSYLAPDKTVATLLAEASAVLAGSPALEVDHLGMGPKPIPGDGEPVLGELESVPGLHVIFTHSGATLALIVGELIANSVVTGVASPLIATFSPQRFGGLSG